MNTTLKIVLRVLILFILLSLNVFSEEEKSEKAVIVLNHSKDIRQNEIIIDSSKTECFIVCPSVFCSQCVQKILTYFVNKTEYKLNIIKEIHNAGIPTKRSIIFQFNSKFQIKCNFYFIEAKDAEKINLFSPDNNTPSIILIKKESIVILSYEDFISKFKI